MNVRFLTTWAVLLLGYAASASAQSVSLQFDNGRVTLVAQDAPIRTILAEWARLGGTRIVNGERVGGAPVTLELNGVPERQALETLLRTVPGYVITPREAGKLGASAFGGVMILATTTTPRPAPPVTFASTPVQPVRQQQPALDEAPEPNERLGNTERAPAVSPFTINPGTTAGPVVLRPGTPGQDTGTPTQMPPQRPPTTLTTLPGTSRPGEVTPQQQPNQPNQPNQR